MTDGRRRRRAGRRIAALSVAVTGTVALLLGGQVPAGAAPNDGVFVFEADGSPLDQSIDDYCQEFFDEFHSGGCTVEYVERSGEFRSGTSVRVSTDGVTCPGAPVSSLTVVEEVVTTRSLGFKLGPAVERAFGAASGATLGLVGSFDYSDSVSEGSTVGFDGLVDEGNIGSIHFTPTLWSSVGVVRYTDQYDDTVITEVEGSTPAKKVNGFTDGTYRVDQRPMTAQELATFC